MAIKQVGVIGCGLMGSGIAQVSAQAGFPTVVIEANQALLDKGLRGMRKSLEGLCAKAKMEERAKDETLERLKGSTQLEDLKDCDLVIEAITENQLLKNETFSKLDTICRPHALLASNTSSCNVTAMAAATKRPGQVLGLHFFNPVPLMKLVEVVQYILTDDAAVAAAYDWVQAVGKVPVKTRDSTAFIDPRLRGRARHARGHRPGDEARLRIPDGAVHAAGPGRAGHDHVRRRGDVRGVPRAQVRAPAAPQAHGDRGQARAQDGARLLRLQGK